MTEISDSNRNLSFLAGTFTVFLCALFGANAVAIKMSLAGLGVFTTAGLRFSMASIAIALWAAATGRSFRIPKGCGHHLVIVGAIFAAQLSLFYLGLSKTNASRGALLANFQPFFLLFLAHFFIKGDRITRRKLAGMLMGFSGVAFVFWDTAGITSEFRLGDAIIFLATFLWACNGVYVKRVIHTFQPFQMTFYPMLISVPLFFGEALLWDPAMVERLTPAVIGALLYQGLITASFGFVAWNTLLRNYGAVSIHSFIFIMPIAGVILGAAILGEPVTAKLLLALILIVLGILTINLRRLKLWPSFLFYRG